MLRTCTTSTESSLVSLTAYKAAVGTTSTADDTALDAALIRATSLVEGYLGYPLRRQVYEETVPAYNTLELMVSRTPLLAIESIIYGDETLSSTDYNIENEQAGFIYRELGWPWTASVEYDLGPRVVPKSELRSVTVVYEAGYCVNGSTADGWLTTGEPVPAEIESAIISTATYLRSMVARDPSVTSRKIGDLTISYRSGSGFGASGTPSAGIPEEVKGLIGHLRRF